MLARTAGRKAISATAQVPRGLERLLQRQCCVTLCSTTSTNSGLQVSAWKNNQVQAGCPASSWSTSPAGIFSSCSFSFPLANSSVMRRTFASSASEQELESAQQEAEKAEGLGELTAQARHGDTTDVSYLMTQPSYEMEYLESIKPRHKPPEGMLEHLALYGVRTGRWCFDKLSGYNHDKMTERQWLRRIIFLETIAGVPGMVGGMLRHMRSLRSMRRDNGWIHTLLEEAENERMHLLTFLELRKPSMWMRTGVLLAQGAFFNFYFLAYLISPKLCHSAVGYLEEEAVRTYTHAIKDIDEGRNPGWADKVAPQIAIAYWKLGEGAKMRHLLLAVRADESAHNHVNHVFANMDHNSGTNPFAKNAHVMP